MTAFPVFKPNVVVVGSYAGGAARVRAGRSAASSCRALRVAAGGRAAVLASRSGGRRAIVAAAASAPGGRRGTAFDGEAVVTEFRSKLEAVKFCEFAFVDPDPAPPSETIMPVLRCAGYCVRLLDVIVSTETMTKHQFEDVAVAGECFMRVAGQCVQGYVTVEALIQAQKSLQMLADFFWPAFEMPEALRVEAVVPAGDFLQMRTQDQEYLDDVMQAFILKGYLLMLVATTEYKGSWILFDSEAAFLKLRVKLDIFQFTHHPMAIVCVASSELLATALETANDCMHLLENLLHATPVSQKQYQVLLKAGEGMMSISVQCRQGYLRASNLVEAPHDLRLVGECFLPGFVFPRHLLSFNVPFTSDGLQVILPDAQFPNNKHADKEKFFQDLLEAFVLSHSLVTATVYEKYGFGGSEEI